MGEDAGLGRNFVALDDGVEHLQKLADALGVVGGRVDADHRVAVAVEQAVENARGDAGAVVGGVVGLQAGGHPPAQADGVAKARDHADLLRHQDQVLHAHQLGDRGDHFRRQPRCQGGQRGFVRRVAEQPVAEIADGEVGDRGEGGRVVAVDDQAGHLVAFVGDQRLVEKAPERHLGQAHLRRDALGIVAGGDTGQAVAGTRRAGLGQQFAQAVEAPGGAADTMGKAGHRDLRRYSTACPSKACALRSPGLFHGLALAEDAAAAPARRRASSAGTTTMPRCACCRSRGDAESLLAIMAAWNADRQQAGSYVSPWPRRSPMD